MSEADLLYMALHGNLSLSVVFPDDMSSFLCVAVDDSEVKYNEVPSLDGTRILRLPVGGTVFYAPNAQAFQVSKKLVSLESDWPYRLAMVGGEIGDVRQRFWDLTGRIREETISLDGVFVSVQIGRDRVFFQLLAPSLSKKPERYPLGNLPENAVLVLEQPDLLAFVERIETAQHTKRSSPKGQIPIAGKWPWGSHHTELLGHLEAAAHRSWANFDPTDNTTAPTNEAVSAWLAERGVSKRGADAIASILRVNGLPTGPRSGT